MGRGSQPGSEETLEAVLVTVTAHVGFAGCLGHDIAAVLLGEECVEGRLQQAIDTLFPFLAAVGLPSRQLWSPILSRGDEGKAYHIVHKRGPSDILAIIVCPLHVAMVFTVRLHGGCIGNGPIGGL